MEAGLEIIQVVRRLASPSPASPVASGGGGMGGVGGAVAALDVAFRGLGVQSRILSAESLGLRPARGRLGHAREVVTFTLRGTLAARRARRSGAVVLVHGDALGGDIYVDHGLHKALLARRPWLAAHPLHAFIWAREEARHALPGHRRVACLSPGAVSALRTAFPLARRTPAAAVANGVNAERFRPDPARMAHFASLDDCRLVFVGREFARKGLVHALDALSRLPPGVTLEVIGGRPGEIAGARRRARALGVERRVAFLGVRGDVAERLRRCDVLVLPSAVEASPLAVLEAMASGVPVLLSGAPGGEALLGHGAGGRVVEASGEALAQAVRAMAADPAAFLQLRWSARAWAERHTWTRAAQGYLALAEAVRRERDGACAS